jgi:1,4-alpha-glucan branching enzyme
MDVYLFREGRHHRLWEMLGSFADVKGCRFAVWAPNAKLVGVAGHWNDWNGRDNELVRDNDTGVWVGSVPGVTAGAAYKFDIVGPDGVRQLKADPMARAAEVPPSSASIVVRSSHHWTDDGWMTRRRASAATDAPSLRIYELHLASWRTDLHDYQSIAHALVEYVNHLGFTHVELLPVMEHPFGGSWGYQVTGYFAPTSRFGSPDDFRAFVNILHDAGVGVILDWVPAHFPKDDWALARFDGTALYEHLDPRQGEHPDWGTYIFNYGRMEVRNFLVANALYWLDEFHIDGLRVDAVASMLYLDYSREAGEWVPNRYGGRENLDAVEFLRELTSTVATRGDNVLMVAEESTSWPLVTAPVSEGGLGFTHKWNMGWMHDTLTYLHEEAEHRRHHHDKMTFGSMYLGSERWVLPLSHDEVVHGKGSLMGKVAGDDWQKFANVRALYGWMWAYPGGKLVFSGDEFAQRSEWNETTGIDWSLLEHASHRGVFELTRTLNAVSRVATPLWDRDELTWLSADDRDASVFAFVRWSSSGRESVVCIANFRAEPCADYRVGLPWGGTWTVLVNTDAARFGGTGHADVALVKAEHLGAQGQGYSGVLTMPPLAVVWLGSGT